MVEKFQGVRISAPEGLLSGMVEFPGKSVLSLLQCMGRVRICIIYRMRRMGSCVLSYYLLLQSDIILVREIICLE